VLRTYPVQTASLYLWPYRHPYALEDFDPHTMIHKPTFRLAPQYVLSRNLFHQHDHKRYPPWESVRNIEADANPIRLAPAADQYSLSITPLISCSTRQRPNHD
jgi:hypothetical protein